MIKLIVSDLDGTLLPYGQARISDEIIEQIRCVLAQGTVFAVSSGRTYAELAEQLGALTDKLYLICCDGAYYVKEGKCYCERAIEHSDLELFFEHMGTDFSFVLHGAKSNFSVGNVPAEAAVFAPKSISRLGDVKEKIFKITAYGEPPRRPKYSGLRTHWDGGENKASQYVNRFCDKGTALSDLQVRLMLTKFDTACLGDGGNDVSMMKNAKYTVSIGRRSPELLAATELHFSTAEEAFESLLKE